MAADNGSGARRAQLARESTEVAERHAQAAQARLDEMAEQLRSLQGAREAELARRERAADASSAAASQLAASQGPGWGSLGEASPAALRAEARADELAAQLAGERAESDARLMEIQGQLDGLSAQQRALEDRLISQAEAAVPPDWGTASDAGTSAP